MDPNTSKAIPKEGMYNDNYGVHPDKPFPLEILALPLWRWPAIKDSKGRRMNGRDPVKKDKGKGEKMQNSQIDSIAVIQ